MTFRRNYALERAAADSPRISPAAIRWLLLLACVCFLLACASCGWLGYKIGAAAAPLAIPARLVSQPHRPQPSDVLADAPDRARRFWLLAFVAAVFALALIGFFSR